MPRAKKSARGGVPLGDAHRFRVYHRDASDEAPRELSDDLIEYVSRNETGCEPPRKRLKMMPERNLAANDDIELQQLDGNRDKELDYIVVNQSTWDIRCAGSKLSGMEMPLERSNIRPYVLWAMDTGTISPWLRPMVPQYIEIQDHAKNCIFRALLPEDKIGLEDVLLALDIDHELKKRAGGQGKIWTEFGIVLLQKDGTDYVRMVFTIKWNLASSLDHVAQSNNKIPSLSKVLSTYFPDPNATKLDTWSPQDFYQSVHTPSKDDKIAASINTNLESNLYPFQKRALRWMLQKEGVDWSGVDVRACDLRGTGTGDLPISFIKTRDARGRLCYVSHLYGCATLDLEPFRYLERSLKGGILAEEMGLGKTLEIISLINLHKRPQEPSTLFDTYIGEEVRPIAATLIVCPPSLVLQWISEIQRHSNLKVMHYEGINKLSGEVNTSELLDTMTTSDVVVSTYSVLAGEIHYTALNPEKTLRRESKYPRPKSPLMMFSWWRICIDEAQMVESGVSKAAVVARMIPRVNAWCITGTPVRRDVNDLLGLLIFLRVEPFASKKDIWSSLISVHKSYFRRLFGYLALRHSKREVRDELRLPAQRRYVITMPFTPIEEQHYQELFNQMCEETGLDTEGAPLSADWDPDVAAEPMRRWYVVESYQFNGSQQTNVCF